jgi:hypothetical protein
MMDAQTPAALLRPGFREGWHFMMTRNNNDGGDGQLVDGKDDHYNLDRMATIDTGEPVFAVRIENRRWVNDITLPQAWAILHAAFQELAHGEDLLFMVLLPSGEQPALCLSGQLFELQAATPQALAARLLPRR